jgi:polysaccharide biosynthesis protein PelA
MRLAWAILFIHFVVCYSLGAEQGCEENPLYCPWVVYYGHPVEPELFKPYNPIVLEPGNFPEIPFALKENKVVYAYLSLGEISKERPYFNEAKELGLLLGENPNWPGSYYVDVRQESWARLVLDRLIPALLVQGFQGIFLDTLDDAIYLEQSDPDIYKGMKKGAVQLVQLIRVYFPNVHIMLNRSYELLPEVGSFIDALVAESLYTEYSFSKKIYEYVPADQYASRVQWLQQVQKKFPYLQIFSLDYWYPEQLEVIENIYAKERENGFRPYVSVIGLDQILSEPKEMKK